ncbi:hypothetical protein ATCV1_z349L [Acanthocystis turfacea chlorella virus 1]|uniref:Uncharacterized protein z349L n=1 Tax=Chlorovirus heliozoae TaxID=322019 RepID=A7K8V9_9PHYC|nr:hypothetical protein ATCV1_z349L [Acanthocystis turfacea chlorella virus 1]ABT16483.1 hypothetical protein ATCV1_z349L [Acanthocystis turfacea chlorella virus 1]
MLPDTLTRLGILLHKDQKFLMRYGKLKLKERHTLHMTTPGDGHNLLLFKEGPSVTQLVTLATWMWTRFHKFPGGIGLHKIVVNKLIFDCINIV